jgi:hypothetical protein
MPLLSQFVAVPLLRGCQIPYLPRTVGVHVSDVAASFWRQPIMEQVSPPQVRVG